MSACCLCLGRCFRLIGSRKRGRPTALQLSRRAFPCAWEAPAGLPEAAVRRVVFLTALASRVPARARPFPPVACSVAGPLALPASCSGRSRAGPVRGLEGLVPWAAELVAFIEMEVTALTREGTSSAHE